MLAGRQVGPTEVVVQEVAGPPSTGHARGWGPELMDRAGATTMQRLTVLLGPRDHVHHHSVAIELLARARAARLSGATLLEAVEGQGRSGVVHRPHLFSADSPLCLLIVEDPAKLERFIEENRDLLESAIVVIDEVKALRA